MISALGNLPESGYRYARTNITRGRPMPPTCRRLLLCLACLVLGNARAGDSAKPELLVFAASSLTNVLEDIGSAYSMETGQTAKFSFGSSATIARQIEGGARADVFFSADVEWMDY